MHNSGSEKILYTQEYSCLQQLPNYLTAQLASSKNIAENIFHSAEPFY